MYIDWTYIYLVLPAVAFAMWASAKVNSTFRRYSDVYSQSNITGREAAQMVLQQNGVFGVGIEQVPEKLSDHYDPRSNTIRLSQAVYNSTSAAAIGVAAHEAGHAVQYAKGYSPIKVRAAILPAANIGSGLAMPLILLGILLSGFGAFYQNIAYLGVACFGLCTLFQLVTLPVEYNASNRALEAISSASIFTAQEQEGARKVLSAAALTYVASLAVSIMQLLRLILLVNRNNRRD